MCDCIEVISKKLEEEHNTKLETAFVFSSSPATTTTPETNTISFRVEIATYIKEKKRGAKPVAVTAIFCPFCGVRYLPIKEKGEPDA